MLQFDALYKLLRPFSSQLGFGDARDFCVLLLILVCLVLLVLLVLACVRAHRLSKRQKSLKNQVAGLEAIVSLGNGTMSDDGSSVVYENPHPEETPLPYGAPAPRPAESKDETGTSLQRYDGAGDNETSAELEDSGNSWTATDDALENEIAARFRACAPVASDVQAPLEPLSAQEVRDTRAMRRTEQEGTEDEVLSAASTAPAGKRAAKKARRRKRGRHSKGKHDAARVKGDVQAAPAPAEDESGEAPRAHEHTELSGKIPNI